MVPRALDFSIWRGQFTAKVKHCRTSSCKTSSMWVKSGQSLRDKRKCRSCNQKTNKKKPNNKPKRNPEMFGWICNRAELWQRSYDICARLFLSLIYIPFTSLGGTCLSGEWFLWKLPTVDFSLGETVTMATLHNVYGLYSFLKEPNTEILITKLELISLGSKKNCIRNVG